MVSTARQLSVLLPADGQQRASSVRQRTSRRPRPRTVPHPERMLREQRELILHHLLRRARQEACLRRGVGTACKTVGARLEESQLPKVARTVGKSLLLAIMFMFSKLVT